MWSLLVSTALGETLTMGSTESLAAVVERARDNADGSDIIVVLADYDGVDESPVDLGDLILEIQGNGAQLPALYGTDVALTLVDARIVGNTHSFAPSLDAGRFACALCFERGAVTLSEVGISGVTGYGLVIGDANVTATNLVVQTGQSGAAAFFFAVVATPEISLTDSIIEWNSGIGLKFYGAFGKKVIATLIGVTLSNNQDAAGSAIHATNSEIEVHGGSIDNNSALGFGAPISLDKVQLSLVDVSIRDNEGKSAGVLESTDDAGGGVYLSGGVIAANSSSGSGIEFSAEMLTFSGVEWHPGGYALATEFLTILDSLVNLDTINSASLVGSTHTGEIDVWRTRFCGAATRFPEALLSVQGGNLSFIENVVHGSELDAGAYFALSGADGSSAGTVSVVDNTFYNSDASGIFSGTAASLTFTNNLVYGGNITHGLSPVPIDVQADHNLFFETTGDFYKGLPLETGMADGAGDPMLDPSGILTDTCGAWPDLLAASPAINAGDTSIPARDGQSDIGARDFGGNYDGGDTGTVDTGDTGDSGTVDTGDSVDDSGTHDDDDGDGVVSADDCDDFDGARFPGAFDVPDDDIDQDCDGVAAVTSFGGGCGCDAGPGALAGHPLLLVLPLAIRRRRT